MLIHRAHLDGIAAGTISQAFRRWRSPTVKTGGTLRTAIGVLAIEKVEIVDEDEISRADAEAAGYSSREELLADLQRRAEGVVYRIRLRLSGADPREQLREQSTLTPADIEQLRTRLSRFDKNSTNGAWTRATLDAIATHPGTRAADLARHLGFEKMWLKANIRKLKELGLTESLEVGYRLSPRGRALRDA